MGYVIIYILGLIVLIVLAAYEQAKEGDLEGGVTVFTLLLWPITIPILLIIFGCFYGWESLVEYFKRRIVKRRREYEEKRKLEVMNKSKIEGEGEIRSSPIVKTTIIDNSEDARR
jgi:ABC-type arginine transport system permease subunit